MSPLHVSLSSTGCLPVLPLASFHGLKENNFQSVCVNQVSFSIPVSMIASERELSRSSVHLLQSASNHHAFYMTNLLLALLLYNKQLYLTAKDEDNSEWNLS